MKYIIILSIVFSIISIDSKADPGFSEYEQLLKYGAFLFQFDDSLDNAIRTFEDVCHKYPDSARACAALASGLIKQVDLMKEDTAYRISDKILRKAMSLCNHALDLDTTCTLAFYNRGLAALRLGMPKLAEQMFKKVIEIEPYNMSAYLYWGLAIKKQHHSRQATDDALDIWRQAIKINPVCPEAAQIRAELGKALYMAGFSDSAKAEFDRAIAVDSTNLDAIFGLAQTDSDLEQAISFYKQGIIYDSSQGRFHNALGDIYHIQRDLLNAIKAWNRVITSAESNDFQQYAARRKIALDLNILVYIMKINRDVNFQMAVCLAGDHYRDNNIALFSTRGELERAINKYIKKMGQEYTGWYLNTERDFYITDSIGKKLEELEMSIKLDENEAGPRYRLAIFQQIIADIAETKRDSMQVSLINTGYSLPKFEKESPLIPPYTKVICGSNPMVGVERIILKKSKFDQSR